MKILIRKSYLSKNPLTKKKGYYNDYIYTDRLTKYLTLSFLFLGIIPLIIWIKNDKISINHPIFIGSIIVFFVLSVLFSMDAKLIKN